MKCDICGLSYSGQAGAPCPHGAAHRRQWEKETGATPGRALGICMEHEDADEADLCPVCLAQTRERLSQEVEKLVAELGEVRARLGDKTRLIDVLHQDQECLRETIFLMEEQRKAAADEG